mgnify:CR=1 FL=1
MQYNKAILDTQQFKHGYTQNFNDVYHFPQIFDDMMIEDIHRMVYENDVPFQKGQTGNHEESDNHYSNNRDIAYLHPEKYCEPLYNFLESITLKANQELFHIDVNVVSDPLHYVIYPEPQSDETTGVYREEGGYLDWHMDIGQGGVNHRKLATIVQLSDPKDYEGGELKFFFGGRWPENIITMDLKKGDACVFPAFYMHGVTPITKGKRYSIITWMEGDTFR